MDLVIIYGPPAAGKLTVAQELQKLTRYKLFHNHFTVDLVRSIFSWGEGPFFDLSNRFRRETLKAAAKHGIEGVIFTFCYVRGEDDATMRSYISSLRPYRVKVHMVHLYCQKKHLLKRVISESRRKYKKMKTATMLKRFMKASDCFTPYPHPNTLRIDNTDLPPRRAAQIIKRHFRL